MANFEILNLLRQQLLTELCDIIIHIISHVLRTY